MPTRHRKRESKDTDSGSDNPATSKESPRSPRQDEAIEGPPTPTSPLEARSKKRRARFEDDPVEIIHTAKAPHRPPAFNFSPTLKYCLCQPEPKIPRPRNVFILYRSHHAQNNTAKESGVSNPEQSKILGEKWKALSKEEKAPWYKLYEEELLRHAQQYPGYQYRPKRPRSSSNADSPSNEVPESCQKCGGLTMLSPTTPGSGQSSRPILPPVHFPARPDSRALPPVNTLNMPTPDQFYGAPARQTPPGFHIPEYQDYSHYDQFSPDAKRRRFTNGGAYGSMAPRPQAGTPYPMQSPHAHQFGPHPGSAQQLPGARHPSGSMGPPPRPSIAHPGPPREPEIHAPSVHSVIQSGKGLPVAIMEIPWQAKIKNHNKVCPPLRLHEPGAASKPDAPSRGAIIAIEGDNDGAVARLGQYLDEQLKRETTNDVSVERGPPGPLNDRQATIPDFLSLVTAWQRKSLKMTEFTTSNLPKMPKMSELMPPKKDPTDIDDDLVSPTNASRPNLAVLKPADAAAAVKAALVKGVDPLSAPPAEPKGPRKPIILLHRYIYHATNLWASRLPIQDAYDVLEHWQWFATMWRGMAGPDLTIFVKDCTPEEIEKSGRAVELISDLRVVLVKRDKMQNALGLEESTFRRVKFEVEEWVQGMAVRDALGPLVGAKRASAV